MAPIKCLIFLAIKYFFYVAAFFFRTPAYYKRLILNVCKCFQTAVNVHPFAGLPLFFSKEEGSGLKHSVTSNFLGGTFWIESRLFWTHQRNWKVLLSSSKHAKNLIWRRTPETHLKYFSRHFKMFFKTYKKRLSTFGAGFQARTTV